MVLETHMKESRTQPSSPSLNPNRTHILTITLPRTRTRTLPMHHTPLPKGIDCINVALCSRGSVDKCIENVMNLASDPDALDFDDYKLPSMDLDFYELFYELIPTMCSNGCFDTVASVVSGGYELTKTSPGDDPEP